MKKRTIGLLFLCAICMCLLTACGSKTVDMKDYIAVEFTGFDTLGSPEVTVDWNHLVDKLFGNDTPVGNIDRIFDVDYDRESTLSNGDTFTIDVTVDAADAERYKFTLKEPQISYTVKGLTEAQKVDVFENIEVSFSGFEPNGEVSIKNAATDPFLQNVGYIVKPRSGLKNGDVVTVRAGYNPQTVEQYGCVAKEREQQYTVEGLGMYISDCSQLDRAWLDYIVEIGAERIRMSSKDSNDTPDRLVELFCPEYESEWTRNVISNYGEPIPTGEIYFFTPKSNDSATQPIAVVVFECSLKLTETAAFYDNGPDKLLYDGICYFGIAYEALRIDTDGAKYADEFGGLLFKDTTKDKLYESYRQKLSPLYVFYEPVEIDTQLQNAEKQ